MTNLLFSSVWQKKVWQMNRLAKGLLIVTINLDGFSLTNQTICQIRQTFYLPNFPVIRYFDCNSLLFHDYFCTLLLFVLLIGNYFCDIKVV